MRIALDATYSLGRNLSGVGVYSCELLFGLARRHPQQRFLFYYRPHRFLRSFRESLPSNASRRLLRGSPSADLFHALNQRVDARARHTVSTFHDLFVISGDYSTPEFRARFTDQARQAAENSDAIISVSQFTASQVERYLGFPASRIHVIPHGVHMPPEAPAVAREKMVLFVGAIQRRKNIARLVKAFEQLPDDWRLVLAGAPDGFGAEDELRAVEASPCRSRIEVPGYVTREQLENLYRRARIFAFPSLDEGFGIPILEAMAYGIPVVTSNCSAMPEVAGNAAIQVDPLDSSQIGEALRRIAQDDELGATLIGQGLDRARAFSWESVVDQTWEVYRTVAG